MKLKWFFIICGVALTLVVLMADPMGNLFVPEGMIGRWVASSPKYQNRYLELSRVSVVYGTGEESLAVNFVTSVDEQDENGTPLYTINYANLDKEEGYIRFYWYPSVGEIRLKNQENLVWKKTAEMF